MVTAVERSAVTDATGSMHGFPAALTSFVGRAGVVDEIAGQLGQYRLVTVTGPGGAGKTRLAGEVAKRVAGRFADGVWLAELAAVRDPAKVAAAVAAALGIRELPAVAAADALAQTLARRQLLLVLDNCEQVIDAAAELCGRLLLGADDVRVLATSREPLQIAGEARYRLAPLTLPDPDDPADPDGSEAVALFADRARRADASFVLDGETAPVVARLVARLDGMPLAIELAAARVEALGVAQLLDRIDDRFILLEAGDRLAAARQRSLAATVEWSYRLLDERERRVFRAVSVFPGPFTLEGAEAVAGPGAGPTVLHLVDCSLLVPPRAGPDGRSRYVMLETLRAYGAGLLAEAGEGDAVAAALAGYALRVAEDAMSGLMAGTSEVAAARRLDAEGATMRQVLDWAMEHGAAVAPPLAAALAWWWQIRGRLASQVPLLRAAVDRAAAGSDAWCAGHAWLGQASLDSADPAGALRHFTAVRDAIGDSGPFPLLARCLSGRSATLLAMGRIAEAAEDARRAVALARDGDYPLGEALALAALGLVACVADDRVGAVQLARRAEQIMAGLHGPMARVCSHILTTVLIAAGDLAAAERICASALAGARDAGDLWSLGNLLEKMVVLDLQHGPLRGRRRAPAGRTPDRFADRLTGQGARGPGLLRVPVRLDRTPRRGRHGMGGGGRAPGARGVLGPVTPGSARGLVRAAGTPARSPAGARAGPGAGGRGTRPGDEPGHRGRVRSHAHRRGPGAAGRGTGPGSAQPPGTGAGHPGRPGAHRCADRQPAVHQRAHGQLAPGPHPRQDRMPAPRRPHPPGPQRQAWSNAALVLRSLRLAGQLPAMRCG